MSLRALRQLRPVLRAAAAAPAAARAASAPRASVVAAASVSRAAVVTRAFHVSPRVLGSGQSDGELAAALAAEHAYEVESASASDAKPQFLEDLAAEGVWSVQDTPGSDDVVLSRQFGDEALKLTFQVSDLDNAEPVESVDEEGNPVDDAVEPAYITSSLLITKPGSPSALLFDLAAQPDGFEVTNVAVYDRALAEADGATGDWQRRSQYMGPQFDTLDSAVQDAFQGFLAERGVDEGLANFIVSYSEFKEQKDYVSWLADVKAFVTA